MSACGEMLSLSMEGASMQVHYTPQQLEEYRELSAEYKRVFGDMFPAYVLTAEHAIAELKRCLETGEPSEAEARPAALY